jgi:hypothetical protein
MVEEGTITCTCGSLVEFDTNDDRVHCDCGADYIVTVTQIKPPSDD